MLFVYTEFLLYVSIVCIDECEFVCHIDPGIGSNAIMSVCICSRVQNDQLAVIFLLLMQNQEALGEVTEGDMEEQLKLYSL